jgi:hypothetical protein
MPRIRPLASSAISAVWTMSRACSSPRNTSERVPTHFTGRASFFRGVEQRTVFRVGVEAHAEAAADFLGDDAHLLGRHAEHRRELAAHRPHALRGGVQEIQILRRVVGAHRRARLHRVADHAGVIGGELHHLRRFRERRVRGRLVAPCEIEHQVARRARMELGRARRDGLLRRGHRRQILVVDDQRLGRVLRLRGSLGDDQRDRFAHVAHHFVREGKSLRQALLGSVPPLEGRRGRDRLEPRLHQLGAADHREHARAFQSLFFLNGNNLRVRAIGADEMAVGLSGEIPVGDIASPDR